MPFNREAFFDAVRQDPFPGSINQQQVDGMNILLESWEELYEGYDLRWLAYCLATSMWETSSTMWPIAEYGLGEGHEYGIPDKTTGQTYFGRGFVQLTWRENYQRADEECGWEGDDSCEWHADHQLNPEYAGPTLYRGLMEGWFRGDEDGRQTLERYFNETTDDPYGARECVNGDKTKKPSWASGASVGQLISGYHTSFLAALEKAWEEEPVPGPDLVADSRKRRRWRA